MTAKSKFNKEEVIPALEVKLGTELFFLGRGESMCEDLILAVKRSPREDFDRGETNFLVNHALLEVYFHGGHEERVKLAKILKHSPWTDISSKEIGLTSDRPEIF